MRYIYLITSVHDNRKYVGQTKNVTQRWSAHLKCVKTDRNHPLYNAMRKYGVENFTISVLEECIDEIVNDRECWWIDQMQSINSAGGFNLRRGTLVNHCHTLESKKKISQSMQGRVFSKEHREKLSQQRGWKHTDDAKQKMSSAKRGKPVPGHAERQAKRWSGSGNPRANVSAELASEIRQFASNNFSLSCAALSRHFNVSYKTVYGIINNLTYKSCPAFPTGIEPVTCGL